MKWLLSLIIFVFSLADVSSQTVTNAFWGVTWGMKDLDAFYVLKEQQLSPEFQQIGNETLVIINNVSYQNVRWEICVFAFSSFKLYDVQFIKNNFRKSDASEDYLELKNIILYRYSNLYPLQFKWRDDALDSYCIENKKTRLCCEHFYNHMLRTYGVSLRYTLRKHIKNM